MVTKSIRTGEPAPEARIYKCTGCGALTAMLEHETAPHCDTCENSGKAQLWSMTAKRIITVSRDVNKEFEKRKKWYDHISDWITAFCGSMTFVFLHVLWFGFWIIANEGWIPNVPVFDPFPYGLLTMVVSLEAIILATFILVSQNRAGERSELRAEYDYQVDLKSEKKLAEILELLREQCAVRPTPPNMNNKKKKKK